MSNIQPGLHQMPHDLVGAQQCILLGVPLHQLLHLVLHRPALPTPLPLHMRRHLLLHPHVHTTLLIFRYYCPLHCTLYAPLHAEQGVHSLRSSDEPIELPLVHKLTTPIPKPHDAGQFLVIHCTVFHGREQMPGVLACDVPLESVNVPIKMIAVETR